MSRYPDSLSGSASLAMLFLVFAASASLGQPQAGSTAKERGSPALSAKQQILQQVSREDLTADEIAEWVQFAESVKGQAKSRLGIWQRIGRAVHNPWVFFGFMAQATFMMRFVLQLIASERKKRSYVPVAFWYLSLAGGLMLLVYALVRRDPVFVLGQGLGILIYARNLVLIYSRRNSLRDRVRSRAGDSEKTD